MSNYYDLVDELNKASEAYYNGQEIMSNFEYDSKYDMLKRIEFASGVVADNSPTKKVGAPVSGDLPKFKHTYPALSLDKTKDVNLLKNKFQEGIDDSGNYDNDNVVVMWKLDGSTVQAYYKDGLLTNLVTRGNGEVGSDITHNAKSINGIPLTIPAKGDVVVRGEALMSYEDFNSINEKLPAESQYKNPRNLAAASLSLLDPSETKTRNIVVKMFNLVHCDHLDDTITFSGRLKELTNLGFNVVEYVVCSVDAVDSIISKMTEQVSEYNYPVDGLVVAMDNYQFSSKLIGTEHHPNIMQGYAFKWSDETAETILRDIEWSPSRTGLLNPVAVFDPVELEGTTVKRASLHNLSIMRDMRIRIGDRLSIIKANKIIPMVVANLDFDNRLDYTEGEMSDMIGCCPTCKEKAHINKSTDGILTAMCANPNCPEKMIGKLAHFCSRDCMDIQGMSEETIKKLVDAGFIKEYADFFQLDKKPGIAFLPGFGKQSWQKMCVAAEKARTTNFVRFVTSLSIPDIGKGQAKMLLKYIEQNYDSLVIFSDIYNPVGALMYMAQSNFNFEDIEGFGTITSNKLKNWIYIHMLCDPDSPEINVYKILKFTDVKPDKSTQSSVICGKSFCITGKLTHFKNRQELVDKIESLGGKWVDSVSKNTDYLINNDITSTSGKNKKARELGVEIISEQDFLSLV